MTAPGAASGWTPSLTEQRGSIKRGVTRLMPTRSRIFALIAAFVAGIVLAACGSGSSAVGTNTQGAPPLTVPTTGGATVTITSSNSSTSTGTNTSTSPSSGADSTSGDSSAGDAGAGSATTQQTTTTTTGPPVSSATGGGQL